MNKEYKMDIMCGDVSILDENKIAIMCYKNKITDLKVHIFNKKFCMYLMDNDNNKNIYKTHVVDSNESEILVSIPKYRLCIPDTIDCIGYDNGELDATSSDYIWKVVKKLIAVYGYDIILP